jgi:Stage II sporulation protein E (SpoIIE)
MKQLSVIKLFFLFSLVFFILAPLVIMAEDIYWENPEILVKQNVWFPLTASSSDLSVILWQEFDDKSGDSGEFSISLMSKSGNEKWIGHEKVLGPFPFVGDKVSVSSLVVDPKGNIYIAINNSVNGVNLYSSTNKGESFRLLGTPGGGGVTTVSPKLFITGNGSFILFVTQPLSGDPGSFNQENTLGVTYSISSDGRVWSDYQALLSEFDLSNVYLPYHVSEGGKEHVVFQASPVNSRFFHLYYISSFDNGRTWSAPSWITDISEDSNQSENFDNQRVYLEESKGTIYLSWERKLGTSPALSYYGELNTQNSRLEYFEQIQGSGISTNPVNNPQIYIRNGKPVALWYNNIGQVVLAIKDNNEWLGLDIPGQTSGGLSNFCRFILSNNEMNVVWQSDTGGNSGLTILRPDKTVPDINISPINYKTSALSQDIFTVTWDLPSDSSGIAGFSYSLDRNERGKAPETIMIRRRDERRNSFTVNSDGAWFIHIRAVDYAGNWSETITSRFVRDTTAPGSVTFNDIPIDEEGYLLSNTITLDWDPSPGEESAGYSYRIQYLADSEYKGDTVGFKILDTASRSMSEENGFRIYNQDNGLWAFTVNAFDAVGNMGESETIFFRMNKYIPVTYITSLSAIEDDLGVITMSIIGRGFSVGGQISKIILDRDKLEPYDYIYEPDTGFIKVISDRKIMGLTIDDIDEGSYHIGLVHPTRGLVFNIEKLNFESTGTVKFGNFSILGDGTDSNLILRKLLTLSVNNIFFAVVMTLLGIMFIFAVLRIYALIKESAMIKMEVSALINNRLLPSEKKVERMRNMQKRGIGLRIKFVFLMTTLVLLVVLMVSYSLGIFMISTQQKNLTDGLVQTTEVLINSVNTAAGKYLQENNTLELKRLPSLIESMSSARFLTITGPGLSSVNEKGDEFLWVTNDSNIREKVDITSFETEDDILAGLPGGTRFSEGSLIINDNLIDVISDLADKINSEGNESVGVLSEELTRLQGIASELSRNARTEADIEEIRKMQDEIIIISSEIDIKLTEISSSFDSVPKFDPEKIEGNYTFYSPIVYQQRGNNEKFYQGTVRLGISTTEIIKEIQVSTAALINRTVIITLIAIGLGIVGALVLASIIISPINHLLKKVEEIRDSVDHKDLKDFKVKVKNKDQISRLASAVNEMSKGLYKAAVSNEQLMLGKEVQKKFIPLDVVPGEDRKFSTGEEENDDIAFYGFYTGAKGVSGDYFNYRRIDINHYACIKCDISGKDIPASLIMVEVATIFNSFCRNLDLKRDGIHLDHMVGDVNDLIEELDFKGKFAAFTIALINIKNGKTWLSNAGDNVVHYFDAKSRSMKSKDLFKAPAAGPFPTDMMPEGYKQETHIFNSGDIIFMFTDGIEESQRDLRNENLEIIECPGCEFAGEESAKENKDTDTHLIGSKVEEMGLKRIDEIANALLNGKSYKLIQHHNPFPDSELSFNFSGCEDSLEDAVLGLLAVEKVFRMYPDPNADARDRIMIDNKVDNFLKEHFNQYDVYFKYPQKNPDLPEYTYYTHLKETAQYDDLTILGIRRK